MQHVVQIIGPITVSLVKSVWLDTDFRMFTAKPLLLSVLQE